MSWSKINGLGVKQTLKLAGVIVTPTFPFKLGIKSPSGRTMSNECAIVAKNKNISIFAKTSPKPKMKMKKTQKFSQILINEINKLFENLHIRRPTPNGIKYSGFFTFPSVSMNRLGLNSSGFTHRFGSI